MSTITELIGQAAGSRRSIFAAVADAVAAAGRAMLNRQGEAASIRHLESLSDFYLRDIGITRSQIPLVVRGIDIDQVRGRHVVD